MDWVSALERGLRQNRASVLLLRGESLGGDVRTPLPIPLTAFSRWRSIELLAPADLGASAIDPFLPWMASEWFSCDPDRRRNLIERSRFLVSHRRVFREWAINKSIVNPDQIPFSEAEMRFERKAWFSALARLFILLCGDQPRIFVLRQANLSSQGVLQFLDAVIDNDARNPCAIVMDASGLRLWPGPAQLDHWATFTSRLETAERIFSIEMDEAIQVSDSPDDSADPAGLDLRRIENLKTFYCYEDAVALLGRGSDKSGDKGGEYDLLFGECSALLGEQSQAGLHASNAITLLKFAKNDKALLRANLLECRVSSWKRASQAARHALDSAWLQARALADPFSIFQCELHELCYQDSFGQAPGFPAFIENLRGSAIALKLINIAGFINSLVPVFQEIVERSGWDSAVAEAARALKQCKRNNNRYQESVMCHVMGYLHEHKDMAQQALAWFQAGIRLRRKLDDPAELIKVYNGTGYFCFSIGQFKVALVYFSKALSLLEGIGDYSEICMTIFNMAQVFFFAGQFKESLMLIKIILQIMETLGYESIPWNSKPKLESIAGASAWHLGKRAQADDYLHAIETQTVDGEALPFVFLLRGLVETGRRRAKGPSSFFDRGIELTQDEHTALLRIHLISGKALSLRESKPTESEASLKSAVALALERGYDQTARWMESLGKTDPAAIDSTLPLKPATRQLIMGLGSSVLHEAANQRLLANLREIQFLQNFQMEINVGLKREQIFARTLELLSYHLRPVIVQIRDLMAAQDQDNSFKSDYSLGTGLVRLEFDLRESPRKVFDPDELRILALVLAHLELSLKLKSAQDTVEAAVRIDPLTRILNRRAIIEQLDHEYDRCIRYLERGNLAFSILFIDLDHFKYYNDTWGHGAGDWILKRFSTLLKEFFRSMDIVGRYGGDEFLVILPETELPGARLAADRLVIALTEQKGFCAELEQALGQAIDMPPDQWLGCSIGVSIFNPLNPLKPDKLIAEADHYLYQAKQSGRGKAMWNKDIE